jgi:hypothetical protein
MRLSILGSVLAGVLLLPSTVGADVRITIADGRVTLSAKNATIREILTEWARVGQTRIVNVERVTGAPLTLELVNVPEAQALDTVLRSVSGYLAAPRAARVEDASTYDRIFLLPTSTGTPARPAPTAVSTAPVFMPPPFQQDDDQPVDVRTPRGMPIVTPAGQPARSGSVVPFAQPPTVPQAMPVEMQAPPAATPAPFAAPTTPVGVATPGMLVPTPQQPGQQQRPDNP